MQKAAEHQRQALATRGELSSMTIRLSAGDVALTRERDFEAVVLRLTKPGNTRRIRLNYTECRKPALNRCHNLRDLRRPGGAAAAGQWITPGPFLSHDLRPNVLCIPFTGKGACVRARAG